MFFRNLIQRSMRYQSYNSQRLIFFQCTVYITQSELTEYYKGRIILFYRNDQGIPFAIKTILIWNHDCFDCHREWNSERAVEMCRDFVFVRLHLLAFHFNEFRTCRNQPRSISRQTVEGSLGFVQTIKTSKVDRWFGLTGNQDCNRTKGTSCIAMEPHFGCNPDCFDYERNDKTNERRTQRRSVSPDTDKAMLV